MKFGITLLCWSICVAGCATSNESQKSAKNRDDTGNDCIFFSSINNWTVLDRTHLIVWPSQKEAYLINTGFPLEDLPSASDLVFVDADHNGMLCPYGMDGIAVPHSTMHDHATIASIKRLDQSDLQRLSEQYHVALLPRARKQKEAAGDQHKDEAGSAPSESDRRL